MEIGGQPGPGNHARGPRIRRLVVAVVVVAGLLALLASGAADDLDVHTLAQSVRDAGRWGILAYLLAFAFVQPLGISGHIFVLTAALIWPPWTAFGLALAGAVGSASTSFAFSRYIAFDWVQARLPSKIRPYEQWVVSRGLVGVAIVRLMSFTMHPVQYMMGTLRLSFGTMLLGTIIGFVPAVAIDVFLGGRVLDALGRFLAG